MTRTVSEPERQDVFPGVEKIEFESLQGKTVTFKDIKTLPGQYGEFVVALVEVDGKTMSTMGGGKAIRDTLVRENRKKPLRDEPLKARVANRKSREGRIYPVLEPV